jgi:hypothetical protein
MSDFNPIQFGIFLGQLVAQYRNKYALFAIIPHITFVILFSLALFTGNRCRKAFTIYFLINFIWVFAFVGVWFSLKIFEYLGMAALMMYLGTPLLILVIIMQIIRELHNPQMDYNLRAASFIRWIIALPFMIWGFWYPPYEWNVRIVFDPKELVFGAYGLMGCPTTLVMLSLLFLNYPKGNRAVFHALTAYSVIVGFAMVMLKYIPDIPFFIMGVLCLGMIIYSRITKKMIKV